MSRKKFEIYYPKDYYDSALAGSRYKPKGKDMLVMNNNGIFFIFNGETYYPSIRPLTDVLDRYDVVWKEN
jgi:hypothetical protein